MHFRHFSREFSIIVCVHERVFRIACVCVLVRARYVCLCMCMYVYVYVYAYTNVSDAKQLNKTMKNSQV